MDKKVVVGLASFGMSGKVFHAPLLTHHKNFFLKRIVERSRDESRSLYPDVILTRSMDDLLLDPEIELVVVNTPDASHFDLAMRCLDAGKHVIVEKPMTQTVKQGEALLEASRRTGMVLTVFQNRRWDGDFLTVQDIVRDNLLGRLVEFESHYDRYRTAVAADSWKERADAGAGLLYNLGSHMIDQSVVLFGMPEAVTAHLRIVRTGGDVDDWYDLRLHYPDLSVQLRSSYLVREPGPRYILHGTGGSFVKYGIDPQEEALKQGRAPGSPGWGKEPEESWGLLHTDRDSVENRIKIETHPGNYLKFYDQVYESIRAGGKPPVDPSDALNVIRIIEASRLSNRERRTVTLGEGARRAMAGSGGNSSTLIRVRFETLESEFRRVLLSVGFESARAQICARIFAENTLVGVNSHGINRFPRFVQYVRDGTIDVQAQPTRTHAAGALEQWDGRLGPGPLNALSSTERAMALAREHGIGCVALSNTNHWMRGGYFGWFAAKAGFMFIGWTNTTAVMPAWGAVDARIGNNPLVLAVPHASEAIVLDMAMSQFSYGSVESHQLRGTVLPTAGGYDAAGKLTSDPSEVLQSRRLLPIGYWKGSGLSVLLDLLAAILSGGKPTAEIRKRDAEFAVAQVFVAIDPSRLGNNSSIADVVRQVIEDVHGSTPESAGTDVRYPGEGILKRRSENLVQGIPVDKSIWEMVQRL